MLDFSGLSHFYTISQVQNNLFHLFQRYLDRDNHYNPKIVFIKQEERHHAGSFYLDDNGTRLGEMRYLNKDGVMNIYHTEVNTSLGGHNWGFKLVEAGVKFARENDLKILPTCVFAKSVFNRTPEFGDVRVEEAQS